MTDLSDEIYYEAVAAELRDGGRRDGLWLRSLADANGNEHEAIALYAKYRVEQLKAAHLMEVVAQREAAETEAREQRDEITAEQHAVWLATPRTDPINLFLGVLFVGVSAVLLATGDDPLEWSFTRVGFSLLIAAGGVMLARDGLKVRRRG